VESVAWVSERKDVLSTFFGLLSLGFYARYARAERGPGVAPGIGRPSRDYCLALLFFALSLMSKAMLVTLPFLMLLLDYWPLQRLVISAGKQSWLHLLWEKAPFFVLTVISSIVTFFVQRTGGALELRDIPLRNRLANALISYVRYIGKLFWPSDLAALYPYHRAWPLWHVLSAALLVFALSLVVVSFARKKPFLAVGWFWYLGTLVPVIGIVQVGEQSIADRYTYFPSIGLCIALIWAVACLAHHWRWIKPLIATAAVLLLAFFSICARNQIKYWCTSLDLLTHTLTVAGGSAMIHNNMGILLESQNNLTEAKEHFIEAIRLEPAYDRARFNLARILAAEGRSQDAVSEITGMSRAWELEAHQTLAKIFQEQMKTNEAISQLAAAIPLDPTNASLRESFGLLLAEQGKTAEASEQFAALVQMRPDPQSHYHLALLLLIQGKAEESIIHYKEAIRLKPDWPEPLNDLAWLLATYSRAELRDGPRAVELAERACKLTNFREARFLGTLDAAYAEAGRFTEAMTTAEQAKTLALAAGNKTIAALAEERLKLYRSGAPFHRQ
jgi:Putative Zn-dependent protease, contains TPR repeats